MALRRDAGRSRARAAHARDPRQQGLSTARIVGRWSQELRRRSAASAVREVYDYIETCKTGFEEWQFFPCAGGRAVADASRLLSSRGLSFTARARERRGE